MAATDGDNTPARAPDALRLRAPVHKDDAVWTLEVMSRRGRLPGFRREVGGFAVAAHGTPFDKTLRMRADTDEVTNGSVFKAELRLDRRMPTITLVIFVLTVWPGVMLTDSFLYGHFQFYMDWVNAGLQTWWWYVPLTVVSLVMAWFGALKKSEASAGASARETLEKIAEELGGTLDAGADGAARSAGASADAAAASG
jgi:hypothetical protein